MIITEVIKSNIKEATENLNLNGGFADSDTRIIYWNCEDLTLVAYPGFSEASVNFELCDTQVCVSSKLDSASTAGIKWVLGDAIRRMEIMILSCDALTSEGWGLSNTFIKDNHMTVTRGENDWVSFTVFDNKIKFYGKHIEDVTKVLVKHSIIKNERSEVSSYLIKNNRLSLR